MTDDKSKRVSPDNLTKTETVALSESALDKVTGGDITVNKAKTADKQYQAMDAYIKG